MEIQMGLVVNETWSNNYIRADESMRVERPASSPKHVVTKWPFGALDHCGPSRAFFWRLPSLQNIETLPPVGLLKIDAPKVVELLSIGPSFEPRRPAIP
jgi:hypothetical protein